MTHGSDPDSYAFVPETTSRPSAADSRSASELSSVARKLGTQTVIVVLGNVFTLVVGLPLQIYVSRTIGSGGVGVYGLLDAAVTTVANLLGFGIAETAIRFVPEHLERGEAGKIRALVRGGAAILFATGMVAYALLLATLPWLGRLWPALAPYRPELAVMGIMLPLGLVLSFLAQCLRGFQDIRYLVLGSSVLQLSVKAVLTVAALAIGFGLFGYVAAYVIAAACGAAWMAVGLQRKIQVLPASSPAPVQPEWRNYAATRYFGSLIAALTGGLDRFLLGTFAGSSAVGVLVVTQQLQQMPVMFNQMLLMVGMPMFSAAHSRDGRAERQRLYSVMTDWVVRSSLPLFVFLLVFGKDVLGVFGPEFAAKGSVPLAILLIGQMFNLACGPTGAIAMMSGLQRRSVEIGLGQILVVTMAMLVLVPRFGLLGVALAATSGNVLLNTAQIVLVKRSLGLNWWDGRFARWLIPGAATIGLALGLKEIAIPMYWPELAAALVALYVTFVAANFALGLHADDREVVDEIRNRLSGHVVRASARGSN